ncbi:MAG: VOC family protein [Bauldia sp.]
MVQPVPEGMHSLTPQLNVDGADKAIEWYRLAFGAEVLTRMPDPSGKKVWHASLRIGNSTFFVNDVFPGMGAPSNVSLLWLYTDGVDAAWKRALDAGAKVVMPLTDMFWGDRTGTLTDPFGNRWSLAQHVKDMTHDEMMQAGAAFAAEAAKNAPPPATAAPAAKTPSRKPAAGKAPPRKAAAKQARPGSAKKPASRKAPPKKVASKKAPPKKAAAGRSPTRKAAGRKTSGRR